MSGLPCPNCGRELAFIPQYQRQYCYFCGKYAPDGFGDRGARRCPTCTGILSYVAQYERYYCYRCTAYPPENLFMVGPTKTGPQTANEPVAEHPTAIVVAEPGKVEKPKPAALEAPNESKSEPDVLVGEDVPPEEVGPAPVKPPLVRQEIVEWKKPVLMDLCKAYDLDPGGTKEQLKERLLSYLDELERGSEPPETVETTSPVVEEVVHEEPEASQIKRPLISAYDVEIPHSSTEREGPRVLDESPRKGALAEVPSLTTAHNPDTPAAWMPKGLHRCPRCGRKLTFIAQYDRWYCYSCLAYTPRATAKFACPTCGSPLRWISQYGRWWCKVCRRYASSDLPRPEHGPTTTVGIKPAAVRPAFSFAANIIHRHRSPGSAIGLLAFGMLLFVIYEILVDLPTVLAVDLGVVITPDVAFGLRFFAFLLVVVGAMLGLSAVRDRR